MDADDDGDGIPTIYEGTGDVDNDGLANYLDIDSDGDGARETDEVVLSMEDADSDRIDDRFDADIQTGVDANGDGILDQLVFADINNNQIPDFLDKSIGSKLSSNATNSLVHPTKIIDSNPSKAQAIPPPNSAKPIQTSDDPDGDGLSNGVELALGLNPTLDDSDGDGLDDALEVGVNPKSPQDSDHDGIIDALDQDDDNDGILTKHEIQVSKKLSYRLDTDHDGVYNYQDANDDGDNRLTKLEGLNTDYDKDGILDYLDSNDGLSKPSVAKVVVLYDKSRKTGLKAGVDSNLKNDPALAVATNK